MAAEVSPFRAAKKAPASLEATLQAVRDDVLESVRHEHEREMNAMRREVEMLARQVKDVAGRKIEIAAQAPPNVSVTTPEVKVSVPEQLLPDVEIEVNLKELLPVLKEIRDELKKSNKPEVKTVQRDSNGLIEKVIETHG